MLINVYILHFVSVPASQTPNTEMTQRECRICFECDEETMISPCLCKGSSEWVHRHCLDTWRIKDSGFNTFHQCPTCKFNYEFEETIETVLYFKMLLLFVFYMIYECFRVALSVISIVFASTSIVMFITGIGFIELIPLGIQITLFISGIYGIFYGVMGNVIIQALDNCMMNFLKSKKTPIDGLKEVVLFVLIIGTFHIVWNSLTFLINMGRLHWQREWRSKVVEKYVVKHLTR